MDVPKSKNCLIELPIDYLILERKAHLMGNLTWLLRIGVADKRKLEAGKVQRDHDRDHDHKHNPD